MRLVRCESCARSREICSGVMCFWSLMLKPAWLPQQRNDGALPGVFHEKGAVWNLADAQALARDVDFSAEEKPLRPEWAIG